MRDPGEDLVVHAAPEGLLGRALAESATPPRSNDRSWRWVAAAAMIALTAGVGAGWMANEALAPAPELASTPLVVEGVEQVPVRLVLHAPDARAVSVAGTWNDWDPTASPLVPGEDGLFYTVILLPRGRYEYMFVVDGAQWVSDPTAPLSSDDDFGQRNGILDV